MPANLSSSSSAATSASRLSLGTGSASRDEDVRRRFDGPAAGEELSGGEVRDGSTEGRSEEDVDGGAGVTRGDAAGRLGTAEPKLSAWVGVTKLT